MANYTIREFKNTLDGWADAVDNGIRDCIVILGEKIQTDLVERAPVDTGRFRGNMQVTANSAPLYALNQYDKDGSKTIAQGVRAVKGFMYGGGAVRSIHFSNMLIYANRLEYGHSQQAPKGVFGIVSSRLGDFMSQAIREAKSKNAL